MQTKTYKIFYEYLSCVLFKFFMDTLLVFISLWGVIISGGKETIEISAHHIIYVRAANCVFRCAMHRNDKRGFFRFK